MDRLRKIWDWIRHVLSAYSFVHIISSKSVMVILFASISYIIGVWNDYHPLIIWFAIIISITIGLYIADKYTKKSQKKGKELGTDRNETKKSEIQKKEPPKTKPIETKWLLDIAQNDRQDLSKFLCIVNAEGLYGRFDSVPSCITFSFTVFNGSVFHISVDSNIEGHIIFLGKELNRPPQLKINDIGGYTYRGGKIYLTITQYLDQEEVKSMLELKKRSEIASSLNPESFNFEKVKLWIVAEDSTIKDKKYLFSLGKVPYP